MHRQLTPAERDIWDRLSGPDRRHSALVARRVQASLGSDADRAVLAAALLHDNGKTVSGFRTGGRVFATMVGGVIGRSEERVDQWSPRSGLRGRLARYWDHAALGGAILESAGSDPLTVRWTVEHHLPADQCTLDPRIAAALREADDD